MLDSANMASLPLRSSRTMARAPPTVAMPARYSGAAARAYSITMQPASLFQYLLDIRQERLLERRAEGHRRIRRSHTQDRGVEILEYALRYADRELSSHPSRARVFVEQQYLRGL